MSVKEKNDQNAIGSFSRTPSNVVQKPLKLQAKIIRN